MKKKNSDFKWRLSLVAVLCAAAMFLVPTVGFCALDLDDEVSSAVSGGQKYLYNNFTDNEDDTGYYWISDYSDGNEIAATAAAVAALIETGMYSDADYAAQIDKAVAYIEAQIQENGSYGTEDITYTAGLSLVALSLYHTVNPQDAAFVSDYIQPAVDYILSGQYSSGGWSYSSCSGYCDGENGDLSNTQFSVMGLWYAYHYVLDGAIPAASGASVETFVRASQVESGAFSYYPNSGIYASGPMNGAGLWSLAMLGEDQTDSAVTQSLAWFDANYSWGDETATWGYAYYYGVYGMAKGLAGLISSDYVFESGSSNSWVTDLKQALVDNKTSGVSNDYYWNSGWSLDPGPIVSTSFVLMSLGFADPNTATTNKFLPEPEAPDFPIQGEGFVLLESSDGVTISSAIRQNIGQATAAVEVGLPIGVFEFTLNGVTVGSTAVLKITPPAASLDETNANSFINADGTIKDGLSWFKIEDGEWKGQSGVLIRLMPVGGPYKYIEVTLTDGGPEDADGLVNGTIVDPGAPGFGAAAADGGGGGGGDGGGCFLRALGF